MRLFGFKIDGDDYLIKDESCRIESKQDLENILSIVKNIASYVETQMDCVFESDEKEDCVNMAIRTFFGNDITISRRKNSYIDTGFNL